MPEMASSHLRSLLTLVLATCCTASAIVPRNDSEASSGKYLKFPVIHSTNQDVFADVWVKRGVEVIPLANRSDVAYYAMLNIGNPAQPNYVQLDTGSFELWVNPDCSNLSGASDVRFCQAVGSYSPTSSSDAVITTTTKTLRYGIGSASIQYVKDTIGFANSNIQLKNVQFGAAATTVDEFSGILGIGYGINMTITYKNFVDELQAQGATATKAFSLALGSKAEQEGVVIFGGLDTGKFAGTLQSLPIIPAKQSPDGVARYWIQMNSMSLTPPSGKTKTYANTSMAVFLDSGSTLTLLPTALANSIAADFGSGSTDSSGFYAVDCSLAQLSATVDFAFPGVTIHVPYSEIIRQTATGFGTECYLGISPNEDFVLLGDTMLRSAYAVFDQTNAAVYLAQYTNCGTNEVEITATTNMSQITGLCNQPSFDSVATGTTSTSGTRLPTATGTSVSGATAAATSTAGSAASATRPGTSAGWLSVWVGLMAAIGVAGIL